MSRTAEQIVALYEQRKSSPAEKWRNDALLVRDLMNGDLWQPVSEMMGQNEYAVAANTALVHMEQMVKRICSTQPNVKFPALRPGMKTSDEKARLRRLAALGFWDQNEVEIKDRKRVRQLQSYGSGPVQIGIHTTKNIPKWTNRDPLMTYAAPANEDTGFVPTDCVFAYRRTHRWLQDTYPAAAAEMFMTSAKDREPKPDTEYTMIEYLDAFERVLVISHRDPATTGPTEMRGRHIIELLRWEHNLGMCPIVAPTTINLDRIKSPYMENIGKFIMRNQLAALEFIYAQQSVFPETSFVEPPGSINGEIIEYPNGREGIIGHMRGGQLVTTMSPPNFQGTQMIDRLEREERIANSTPADWAGESASNIRTNARGSKIVSEATDYTIQETQNILALAKEHELKIAIAIDKKFCNSPKSFYIGWKGNKTDHVDYTPSDIWENDEAHVYYPAAGTDLGNLVISGGQRVAQQTLSREGFMEYDPMVGDPELERDRIVAEQLEQSILAEMLQPGGALDVVAKARVAELVKSNKVELADAIAQVQRERQEAQATQDAAGNPTAVDPNSPAAQPGIAPEAASGIAAPQGVADLASVLGNLRRPQMTVNGA